MTKGPLGGPRPFASDDTVITTAVGIDGPNPPSDIQMSVQQLVRDGIEISAESDRLNDHKGFRMSFRGQPTQKEKDLLGDRTLSVMEAMVTLRGDVAYASEAIEFEETVERVLSDNGFNVLDSYTTID